MRFNVAGLLTLVFLLASCVPSAERQAYYRTHPMEECRALIRQAESSRGWRNVSATMNEKPQDNAPINPCSIGCRIPVCGYPPSPNEVG
jgi:hypothetical protein